MTHRLQVWLASAMLLFAASEVSAQVDFSKSPEDFFNTYAHKKDNTFDVELDDKDRFGKRFSLHTNTVDWMLTMPNLGIEFDFDKTKLNNRSIMLNAKYNGNTKHDILPKYVFNKANVRLEFRKYWRTGRISNTSIHYEYQMLHLHLPDTLYREVETLDEFGDKTYVWEAYFTPKDSIRAIEYDGDRYRDRLYNQYHNVRRFLSGRTIENPRNWRAYYLGAYAAYDKFSYCIGKKGEQGQIVSFGATAGWSVPLIASAFPHEGGLDLDLGFNFGLPFGKVDKYKYVDGYYDNAHQLHNPYYATTEKGQHWKFCAKYMISDLHVSLVWRFRSIAKKVDLDLVDRYEETEINAFREKANALDNAIIRSLAAAKDRADSLAVVDKYLNDSTTWHDSRIKARLLAILELENNDTTVFHGVDSVNYIRLVLGRDTTEYKKVKAAQIKEAERIEKEHADSLARALRAAEKDSIRAAKIIADSIARDSIRAAKDSIAFLKDSLRTERLRLDSIRRDSLKVVNDSIKAVRAAEKAEQDKIKEAERIQREKERKEQKKREEEIKAAERKKREEEEWIRNAPKRYQDSLDNLRKDSVKAVKLQQRADKMAENIINQDKAKKAKLDKTSQDRSADSEAEEPKKNSATKKD